MFILDGITWDFPCDIIRTAEMTPSEISGLMLDKSYFNDVIGTYMQYTVKLVVPMNMRDHYAQLYEAITNPVDGHTLVIPYGDDTIDITARIANISDVYVRLVNGQNYWKGIQFTAISNYPTKAMTQGEMVIAGRAPLPSVAAPEIGASYTYTSSGWVPSIVYDDADDNYY